MRPHLQLKSTKKRVIIAQMIKSNRLITKHVNNEFISKAVKNEIEFFVVGGTATAFYGCRNRDEVDDLDLLINPTSTNEKKLRNLLRSLKHPINDPEDVLTKSKVRIPLKKTFYLEILTPPYEGYCFNEIERRCNFSYIEDTRVKVIPLKEHLELLDIAIENESDNSNKIEKLKKDVQCLKSKLSKRDSL